MRTPRHVMSVATLAVLGMLSAGCAADADPPPAEKRDAARPVAAGAPEGSCASALEYDGRTYLGHGELMYDPPLSGVREAGTYPPCDDGNGDGSEEQVTVHELRDIAPERAVLANGTVFLAEGRPFPEEIRWWFSSPGCDAEGRFEVTGQWLGVTTSSPPRFDGDLRAPYRLRVHVTDTGPGGEAYDARTITIRVDEDTDPALGRKDVKQSLWEGGSVTALLHCDGERFVAEEVRSAPPS